MLCASEDDCDSETGADWLNFVDTALRSLSITRVIAKSGVHLPRLYHF